MLLKTVFISFLGTATVLLLPCFQDGNKLSGCICEKMTSVICSWNSSVSMSIADIRLNGIHSLAINAGGISVLPGLISLKQSHEELLVLDIMHSSGSVNITYSFLALFPNLRQIRLHHCDIVGIEDAAFRDNEHLMVLDVSGNTYLTFEDLSGSLRNLSALALKVLNISGIHTARPFPGAIIKHPFMNYLRNTSLEILDISWIYATEIRDDFGAFSSLRVLNMSGTDIDGEFTCFTTLLNVKYLEVFAIDNWPYISRGYESILWTPNSHYILRRTNHFRCSPAPVYNFSTGCMLVQPSLKTFQARYTNLDRLFWDFTTNTCLQDNNVVDLLLSGSKTSRQIHGFSGFHSVRYFDLAYPKSNYDGVPIAANAFQDMPALEILIIPGAKLNLLSDEELKKFVRSNPRLRILDLADNGFFQLPGEMFKINKKLEILNISNNKIRSINLDVSYNMELNVIDLRNNQMETIGGVFLESVTNITKTKHLHIILSRNELKCDCNLLHLVTLFNISAPVECDLNGEKHVVVNLEYDSLPEILKDVCKSESKLNILVIIGGSCLFVLISGSFGVCFYIRQCRRRKTQKPGDWIITLAENTLKRDHRPTFIVFLAYCSHNSSFVMNTLYPRLNKKLMTMLNQHDKEKLIIAYDKNFVAGGAIDELVDQAIKNSYVTVAVISDEFLKSSWCSFEIKMAYTSNVPLIPLYLNKCNPDNLSGILKLLYNTRVRLLWPDSKDLGRHDLIKEEEKIIDILCKNVMAYVTRKQQNMNNSDNDIIENS